jgi:3-hydroxybutyryl-CoA dehydrogenase
MWEETFQEFSYEIRNLALKYPADIVEQKLKAKIENKE